MGQLLIRYFFYPLQFVIMKHEPISEFLFLLHIYIISQLNIVSIKGYWRGGVNLILVEELYENRQYAKIRHKPVTIKPQIRLLPCLLLSKIRQLCPDCLMLLCWFLNVTKCCRISYNCSKCIKC